MIRWTANIPPTWPRCVKGVFLAPDTGLELVTTATRYLSRGHYCQPTQRWTDEMRAYVHCCIAAHPCFSAKPQHATLTNRIPGSGRQQHKHCMRVCLEVDTNCLRPIQCPEKYMPVWNETINRSAPVSYREGKLLCLEPHRLCFLPSIVFKVIWSISRKC